MENPAVAPPIGDDTSVEWCLGLPLVEHRPLSSTELTQLKTEANQLRKRAWLLGGLCPLTGVLFLGICIVLNALAPESAIVSVIAIFLLIAWFIAMAILFLRARDAWKQSKGINGDVRLAYVKSFAGTLSGEFFVAYRFPELIHLTNSTVSLKKAGNQLAKTETTDESTEEKQVSIEVLPHSHRLWKIDGSPLKGWVEVAWSTVAKLPQFASMAAHWVEPIDISNPEPLVYNPQSPHYGQRELSDSEKGEIKKRIRRLWLGPFWPSLFFTLWFGIPFTLHLLSNKSFPMGGNVYLIVAFALFSYFQLWRATAVAGNLKRDLENGIVVIMRLTSPEPTSPDLTALPQETEHEKTPAVTIEILPISGWQWSEAGKPAEWRKIAMP